MSQMYSYVSFQPLGEQDPVVLVVLVVFVLEKQKEISGPATMISEFLLWGTFGLSSESLTLFPSF